MDPNAEIPQSSPGQQTQQLPAEPLQPAQQSPSKPLGVHEGYCTTPSGGRSLFSYKKSILSLYPGWLIVTDIKTSAEINRIQLTPDMEIKGLVGQAGITYLNGRKVGAFEKGYSFLFYNPAFILLSYLLMFIGTSKSKAFVAKL